MDAPPTIASGRKRKRQPALTEPVSQYPAFSTPYSGSNGALIIAGRNISSSALQTLQPQHLPLNHPYYPTFPSSPSTEPGDNGFRRDVGDESMDGRNEEIEVISRDPRRSVWNSDSHLATFTNLWQTIGACRELLFPFVTIDPAAWNEENARFILTTTEGGQDHSILSLHTYIALSVGALHFHSVQLAEEFWYRARREVEYFFDKSDYQVAMALKTLGFHVLYWKADFKSAAYYLTLSNSICKQLKTYNSDAYVHCLFATLTNPASTRSEMRTSFVELERVRKMPYLSVYGGLTNGNSDLFIINTFMGMCAEVFGGLRLLIEDMAGPESAEEKTKQLEDLVALLNSLEKELHQTQLERHHARLTLFGIMYALSAGCYQLLGRGEKALDYALKYVSNLDQLRCVLGAVWAPCIFVLDAFLRNHRPDLFLDLVDMLEERAGVWVMTAKITNKFKDTIEVERAKRACLLSHLNATLSPPRPVYRNNNYNDNTNNNNAHPMMAVSAGPSRGKSVVSISPPTTTSATTITTTAPRNTWHAPPPPTQQQQVQQETEVRAELQAVCAENEALERQLQEMEKEVLLLLAAGDSPSHHESRSL